MNRADIRESMRERDRVRADPKGARYRPQTLYERLKDNIDSHLEAVNAKLGEFE